METQSGARSLSEAEQSFVRILKNESKFRSGTDFPKRERGFVVVVRGTNNLKSLQNLCRQEVVSVRNSCVTARYRMQPDAGLGTLLIAFISDLYKLRGMWANQSDYPLEANLNRVGGAELAPGPSRTGRTVNIVGDLDPSQLPPGLGLPAPWPTGTLSKYLNRVLHAEAELANRLKESNLHGTIEEGQLRSLFGAFDDESSILRSGDRLILFGEFSEQATNAEEWSASLNTLLKYLPERVGMVFSGAPPDIKLDLPPDDPHFLDLTLPKDTETPGSTQFAYRYLDSSFHSDAPAKKDDLSVNAYANAIARFVLHPQTKPPITIGIHGRWGKGKSSFMNLIDRALVKYAEVNRTSNLQTWNDIVEELIKAESDQAAIDKALLNKDEQERQELEYKRLSEKQIKLWHKMTEQARKNVLSVRFNAWQFEDAKQTWAGLASEISQRLEELLPRRSRQWLKIRYAWKERRTELILNVLLPFVIFSVVAILFALGFFRGISTPSNPDSPLGAFLKLLVPAGSLFTLWYLSSKFVKVAQPISERVLSYVAMPNYREQMGFQHRVRDDLKFVYDTVAKRLNNSQAGRFRVVVYIDDLDRCSQDKIMEILQAINLILADCDFFVFVGMDTEMIYRAINSHYKEKSDNRLADDYLSKIIQISFYLPETRLPARLGYLSTLFSLSSRLELASLVKTDGNKPASPPTSTQHAATFDGALAYDLKQLLTLVPVQIKEAEDTPHELQAFRDYCGFIDDNPREMKRLVNIHRLMKIVVQAEKPNAPLEADRQKKLVKWLIFCDTWPQLVGKALDYVKQSKVENCLLELAKSLEGASNKPHSTEAVPPFDGLKDFATFLPSEHNQPEPKSDEEKASLAKTIDEERRIYTLSSADVDDYFRLAASLSLMIRKPSHRG